MILNSSIGRSNINTNTLYVMKNITNTYIYLSNKHAKACSAALFACLAIRKKIAKGIPLPIFFATPIKQLKLHYKLSN